MQYVIAGVLLLFLIYIFSRFSPDKPRELAENLYVLRCGFANFYAYRAGSEVVMFDTGAEPFTAKRGLELFGLDPDDVVAVFLTHSDYDHAGGLPAYKNAKIYLPAGEEQLVTRKKPRKWFMYNRSIANYTVVRQAETVRVGGAEIKVIETPGHTPGSTSYLIDSRYIATGDLARISKEGVISPCLWLLNMDTKTDAASTEKMRSYLAEHPVDLMLTGHCGAVKPKV